MIQVGPRRPAALLLAAALVVTGCSGSATPSTETTAAPTAQASSTTSAPTAAPSEAPTAAPTATVSPTEGPITGTLTFLSVWTGDEETSFLATIQPWVNRTGVQVKYTGTRDVPAVLANGIQTGNLPDLADVPGPGQLAEYAAAEKVLDLTAVIDVPTYKATTAAPLVDLGTVDGKIYGVFMKAGVKGLMWYSPKTLPGLAEGTPAAWDDVLKVAGDNSASAKATWCAGLESGAASGWPGTDWIEDFILRTAGPDVYRQWYQGEVKWTDPRIKAGWEMFGDVIDASYGGSDYVLSTNFANGGDELFSTPPGCLFHHQANFITAMSKFATAAQGTDYDFFPFPDIDPQYAGAVQGGGDIISVFNDSAAARSLIQYLVTPEAQSIWVGRGGALSPNKLVVNYPDAMSRRLGDMLVNSKIFAFDASDSMPAAMNAEFWKQTVAFVADQSQLDSIPAELDKVQASAYGG